jgi:phage gp29-like protein
MTTLFDRLRGFFLRAPQREIIHVDDGISIPQLPLWAQYQRIGGPLTPEEVTSAIRQADQGAMAPIADLLLDARKKDGHLQSILGNREMMLANLPYEVLAPEGAGRKDRKAADICREALKNAKGAQDPNGPLAGVRGLFAHLQGAVGHGYSLAETVYVKSDRMLWPVGWNLVGPRRIAFEQSTGRPHWWDSNHAGLTYPGIDLLGGFAPGKLIFHQPRITGDVATGEGLGRVLLWAALFRSWSLRDWVALGELAWKPWRRGSYTKQADPDEIKGLVNKLRNLASGGVATFSDQISVTVEYPKGIGPGSSHKELRAELAADMSKAVLGQTLTTEAGERGARSLGEVHDDVKANIRQYDACSVAETIERWFFAPLVYMNLGPGVAVPQLRFLTEEAVDLGEFGEGVGKLRDAGLRIPAAWVRDRAGIPEPQEGDELLGDEIDIPIDDETGLPKEPDEGDGKADDKADDKADESDES